MNILLPIAGNAQRFIDKGYMLPKPLIMAGDKHVIDHALDSVKWKNHNLIFIVRSQHIQEFSIDKVLKDKFGDVTICVCDTLTQGSVCSCLLAKDIINNDEPLLIYTPDVAFRMVIGNDSTFDPDSIDKELDGLLLTFLANSSSHSYIEHNNGVVTKVKEKQVISNEACVGVYYFKHGRDFVKFSNEMIDNKDTTNGEYFIAPVYNYLINAGLKVGYSQVEKMYVLGTPQELEFYADKVLKPRGVIGLCSDHSGFELKSVFADWLKQEEVEYIDFGTYDNKSCDYCDFVHQCVHGINNHLCRVGFGFCRTGQGINIAANKHKNIHSALVFDVYTAEYSVRHNCSNFFSIASKYVDLHRMKSIFNIISLSTFDGGRHYTRLSKLNKI